MPMDDTRDLVIELRAEVRSLKSVVDRLAAVIERLEKEQAKEDARNGLLLWLGAGVLAAAGGTGAVIAKWLGWAAAVTK